MTANFVLFFFQNDKLTNKACPKQKVEISKTQSPRVFFLCPSTPIHRSPRSLRERLTISFQLNSRKALEGTSIKVGLVKKRTTLQAFFLVTFSLCTVCEQSSEPNLAHYTTSNVGEHSCFQYWRCCPTLPVLLNRGEVLTGYSEATVQPRCLVGHLKNIRFIIRNLPKFSEGGRLFFWKYGSLILYSFTESGATQFFK